MRLKPDKVLRDRLFIPESYNDFLRSKTSVHSVGMDINESAINPMLFPFQQRLTWWALRKGRCAIFADCGLGKTFMQLEWARLLNVPTLIVAPLAVAQQTRYEARKLKADVQYVRDQSDVHTPVSITNYEMIEHFDPSVFGAVVLDESSILKSFDGKMRTKLIQMFQAIPYRLCCTATPAPNDIAEIANHAEFLGVMTRAEMLASYFVHDDEGWRLKGHATEEFYRWLATWGMMVKTPSDIGFSDQGYQLSPLKVEPLWVKADMMTAAKATGQLLPTRLHGVKGRLTVRKQTINDKVQIASDVLNRSGEQWIVWCGLNEEGRRLAQVVPDSILVEGSDSLETKIHSIGRFLDQSRRVLITKAKIAGFGMNFQHCHNMMFLGLNDSYEMYYQAIRRCWRFGQEQPVNVVVVLSELEQPILENIERKQAVAQSMERNIINNIAGYEQQELGIIRVVNNGYQTGTTEGEGYTMMLGDCVERMRELAPVSVDFSVFSPPFLNLYTYSDSNRDMGNSCDEAEFFQHFGFLITELLRVMKPGRNVAVHVAQVAAKLASDGYIGLKDFRGQVIDNFVTGGFYYHGDVTIDKNPQAQAIRTHAKGLLFNQLKKDSSWLRPGLADYILIFRKPGENALPIHPDISNDQWITWAHPVWYGINETDTLNAAEGTTGRDERHICPLQLPVIERCIRLWSNAGETVLSPFAGIGSEGYKAILLNRQFIGIELKPEYYAVALRNLDAAITQRKQGRLL